MKLFNRNIFALLAASASLLTSCSDDVLYNGEENKDNHSVTVYVPKSPEGVAEGTGTRGPGSVTDWNGKESQIHSLRLIAYPVKNNQVLDPVSFDLLSEAEIGESDENGYTAYKLNLDNGEYKMYVVANSDVSGTESEGQLKTKTATAPATIKAMEDNGLPMSCAHSELLVNGATITDAKTISVSSTGATAKVRADLKFAVSKVRVTLLNDLRITEGVSEVSVNGHTKDSRLFTDNAYTATAGAAFTPEYAYYDMPAKNAEGLEKSNVDNLTGESTTLPSKEWAWQTVFYVPEKLVADGAKMDYKVGNDNKTLPLGEKTGTGRKIERSHFYDYVGTPDGKFSLYVEEWNPLTILGALFGPTFLHIDKTSIEIEAGVKVPIWFSTNAISLQPKCDTFTNQIYDNEGNKTDRTEELPIYTFSYSASKDTLYVELNKQIDSGDIDAVQAAGKWKSFTLVAGTINKKIEVTNLSFVEYIKVEPPIITIDVAENKASGKYTGSFPIKITTNMRSISLGRNHMEDGNNIIGWSAGTVERSATDTCKSLYVTYKDLKNEPTWIGKIAVPESGEINLELHYTELNSNRKLWSSDSDMDLVVTGYNSIGQTQTAEVDIHVRAAYDVYRIHFKAPYWNHPHIYVYQCLELPSDHPTYPNAPVGAAGDGSKDNSTAAIEYSFTGKIAFKGWYSNEWNNPYAAGSMKGYFYYFDMANGDNSWDTKNGSNCDRHYFMNMDFCSVHRGEQTCEKCKGGYYEKAWPGIGMKKTPQNEAPNHENDWWEFDLTGVATPGKALIMFADVDGNHTTQKSYDKEVRYPDNNQPGIPLFDYPSKEGWISYQGRDNNGNLKPIQFSPQRPGDEDTYYTYRVYWPYDADTWKGINLWQGNTVWGHKIYENFSAGTIQTFKGFKYGKYNNQYAYIEFQVVNTPLKGQFSYQRMIEEEGDDYGAEYKMQLNDFSEIGGVHCYTITREGAGRGGQP